MREREGALRVLFNSLEFLCLFLPVVLFLSLRVTGQRIIWLICVSSFLFYCFAGHPWFLIPMFVTSAVDFVLGGLIDRERSPRKRALFLVTSLAANLGLLCYFKYSRLIG